MPKKLDRERVIQALRDVVREVVVANGGNADALKSGDNPLVAVPAYFDSVSSEEATVMVGVKLGVIIKRNPFFAESQQPAGTFEDIVGALCGDEFEEIST